MIIDKSVRALSLITAATAAVAMSCHCRHVDLLAATRVRRRFRCCRGTTSR